MADVIFLGVAIVFMLIMFIYVGVNVFRARNSRPVRLELVPVNTAKSASTVDLGPYVGEVSGQFAETMDEV